MKYAQWIVLACLTFTTAGCNVKQNKAEEKHPLYKESVVQGQNEIGLFKYNANNYKGKSLGPTIVIDRSLLAKHIASLVGALPNIEEVTTLVTDDHVFMGIQQTDPAKRKATIKEATRTAESVTPRYFKIHVTDKKSLEERINSVGIRMRGNHDVEGIKGDLEQLLRDMGDPSPPNVNESIQPNSRRDVNPNER